MKKVLLVILVLLAPIVICGCAEGIIAGSLVGGVAYQVIHDEIAFPEIKREAENDVYKRLKLPTMTPVPSERAVVVPSNRPGRYSTGK